MVDAFFVCRFENLKLARMPPILYSQQTQVGIITLNRPEKANAFNREMALQLQHILDDCAADDTVRCLMITGAGKAFCAGQDLAELTSENPPGFEQILAEHYNPIVSRIRQIAKPVVAAVNGVAAGAGANIALCADVILASETASFIQAFSKIGLIPDSGGTFILPRLVGWQKASAIMMLGEKISAAEAERIGMIYKTLPAENFPQEALKLAHTLANMPTKGLALTKQALNQSAENTFGQQLHVEDKLQFMASQTSDFKEGMTAFLEKRQPVFAGK